MDKEKVLHTIQGLEYLAGRFIEMSYTPTKVNNEPVVILSATSLQNFSSLLSTWAKNITEEFLQK
jgi:hypothetical protein